MREYWPWLMALVSNVTQSDTMFVYIANYDCFLFVCHFNKTIVVKVLLLLKFTPLSQNKQTRVKFVFLSNFSCLLVQRWHTPRDKDASQLVCQIRINCSHCCCSPSHEPSWWNCIYMQKHTTPRIMSLFFFHFFTSQELTQYEPI